MKPLQSVPVATGLFAAVLLFACYSFFFADGHVQQPQSAPGLTDSRTNMQSARESENSNAPFNRDLVHEMLRIDSIYRSIREMEEQDFERPVESDICLDPAN